MKINFHPDSDIRDFAQAIKEYEEIWAKDGERIVEMWERYSGLKFKETFVNAVVYSGVSRSHPLSLRGKYEYDQKQFVLIHEMGHRLMAPHIEGGLEASSLQTHQLLYLALYDILEEFGGRELADAAVAWDSQLSGPHYKEAWEWALKFNKEERRTKFLEIIKGGYRLLQ